MSINYSKENLKNLIYQVNGSAIEVHKQLGAGLLESVYHTCLKYELESRGINCKSEYLVPLKYKTVYLNTELRVDLIIEDTLVVELKAVEKVLPIHEAQVLTYMKLLNIPIGLMLNFNCTNLYKEGQKTYVNELYRKLKD